ncbi:MAG: putative quinol monooxygenase [Pseudomonadota bacterium]
MISLFVKIHLKEGKAAEFTEEFKEMAASVAKEEGNLLYSLNFAKDAPNSAIIMERYTDQNALNIHSQSDHYKAFGPKIANLVTGAPEITIMEEVCAA